MIFQYFELFLKSIRKIENKFVNVERYEELDDGLGYLLFRNIKFIKTDSGFDLYNQFFIIVIDSNIKLNIIYQTSR